MDALTAIHVVISLAGIVSGFVVMWGMITRKRLDSWTVSFLATTAATSVTGFFFPFHGFSPAIVVGIISLVVLTIAAFARYARHLTGVWRWIYTISASLALYFNVFVLVVQLFQKVPALKALAPTQSEPPFAIAQLIVLTLFVALAIAASIRFRVAPAVLALLVVFQLTQAQESNPGQRRTPSEIAALPSIGAGAGTSGVSGIQTRVLKGDPNKPGLYTIQLTVPANTKIEAHTHADDRVATVVSGIWNIGYGDRFDEAKLKSLAPGSFYTEPPSVAHFARTGNRSVVIQITGFGPTGTTYTSAASTAPNYESRTANLSGARIHYLKAGNGKKALVLIHGFGDTSHMWIPLFDEFGKDYTIIAPDMRGLGESSRPAAGYDKKTIASDIHELVKSLGMERIDLVGHDIGLMVAYSYAAQYPNEVEKLALLEAPIPGIGDVWQKVYTTPALWHFHFVNSPIALDLVKGRERTFLEHFWQTLSPHPETFPEADRQLYANSYAQEGAMRAAFEMFKTFDGQDAADNRKFAANKLPMPVLTIEGDKAMGGALQIQANLVANNVTSTVLTDTGHWLMEQRPAEIKTALKRFFQ